MSAEIRIITQYDGMAKELLVAVVDSGMSAFDFARQGTLKGALFAAYMLEWQMAMPTFARTKSTFDTYYGILADLDLRDESKIPDQEALEPVWKTFQKATKFKEYMERAV